MKKKDDLYCALAYHGFGLNSKGHPIPCCQWKYHNFQNIPTLEWWETERYITEVRSRIISDLENGIKHSGCSQCWEEESDGFKSLRQSSNERWKDFESDKSFNVLDIELNLGSLCNLRCSMCGPQASSLWEAEYKLNQEKNKEWHPFVERKSWVDDDRFLDWLTPLLSTCRRINFSGGEPLIVPQIENILDKIIQNGNSDNCSIQVITNGTKISKNLLEKFKLFHEINLVISLEGVGEKNNYIRFPSKWNNILNNIKALKNLGNVIISVNHVLQHSSVYSLPDLVKFCFDNNFYININSVQGKREFQFDSVPPKDLLNFIQWAESSNWLYKDIKNPILNLKSIEFNPATYRRFRKYISYIDSINGTDWDSTFCPSPID